MALINMKNGLRTTNIASLNPDSMGEEQMQRDIAKDITRNQIHIAAIRETHIAHDRDYRLDNYRIITEASTMGAEAGAVQGGTSVMIHGGNTVIYNKNHKTKQPSTESNTRPIQIKNANPDPCSICAERRTCRSRTKISLGRSQENTQHDMQKTHDQMVRRFQWATGKRQRSRENTEPS